MAITVLIVDDSHEGRRVLEEMVSSHEEFEVVGTARDGREGLDAFRRLRPDVVVTDYSMPEMTGLGLARAVKDESLQTVVVICSDAYIDNASPADVAVSKDIDAAVLVDLISTAIRER